MMQNPNNREIKIILQLLRKVFDSEYSCHIPEGVNWAQVIEKATEQGVLGVCFSAIEQLAPDQRPDMDNLMDWLGQTEYCKTQYEEHKKAIEELAAFYKTHGIRMMLLKGYGLSLNYPVPEHRPTGDIDAFLYGRIDEADDLLENELKIQVDRGNEHHSVFSMHGVMVENHRTFSDQHNHKSNLRLEQLYADLISEDEGVQIGDNIYTPSATLNAIYLVRHAGEHFATEEITLRHVLDLGTFFQKQASVDSVGFKFQKVSEGLNWEKVLKVYEDEQMMSFYNAIATICVRDLGMDAEAFVGYEHNEKLADSVMADIFAKKEALPMSTAGISGFAKMKYGIQKSLRWYQNRWKYKMVYKESLWESYITLALNRLR